MRIDEYERNTEGRDLFLGDLHGCYDKLMDQLSDLNFNFEKDRLYSVGDLIDRGEDSLKCLGLLEEPWMFAIKGNHEQMMMDALHLKDPREKQQAIQLWSQNGGSWYYDLPFEYRLRARKLSWLVNDLPNAIQVGDIGVIHAEAMGTDWELLKVDQGSYCREFGMRARQRYTRKSASRVRNIKAVVVGHTPVENPIVLGNHVYIDCGACFNGGQLIIKSYEQILGMVGKP